MLTSEQKQQTTFRRGTAISKSVRVEGRKGDSLAYITEKRQKSTTTPAPAAAKQQEKKSEGLKGKVAIKQKRTGAKVLVPVSKGAPGASKPPVPAPAEAEEAAEAQDRLAPLPSESLSSRSAVQFERWLRKVKADGGDGDASYQNPVALEGVEASTRSSGGRLVGEVVENLPEHDVNGESSSATSSTSSSDEESLDEGSYDTNGNITARCEVEQAKDMSTSFELTAPLKDACCMLNRHLTKAEAVPFEKLTWAQQYLQHEWLKTAARKNTNPHHVEAFLDAAETYSKQLLHKIVNICDQNENTALHYAVSHGNFDVVSLLLDSKVCNLNRPNKAGYTPVMLAALCPVVDETVKMVIQRLFQMGDVNIKASQHGQTALMLAVSHGKVETSQLLLEAGAGANIQDEDGSTALMCAAEHGHKEIVKLLLCHPEIDASLTDYDGSTALSIAVDNGHRDIGVLIYAHLNYARGISSTSAGNN